MYPYSSKSYNLNMKTLEFQQYQITDTEDDYQSEFDLTKMIIRIS